MTYYFFLKNHVLPLCNVIQAVTSMALFYAIHSYTAKVIFNTTGYKVSHKHVELYTLRYLVRVNKYKKKHLK